MYNTLVRNVHRTNDKTAEKQPNTEIEHSLAPVSKAQRLLRDPNTTPKKPLVRKLITANSVTTEALKSVQHVSHSTASGKFRKKYRLNRHAQAQKLIQRKVLKNNSCVAQNKS